MGAMSGPITRQRESVRLFIAAVLPIAIVLAATPGPGHMATFAHIVGAFAGASVLCSSVLCYLEWRVAPDMRKGWFVAATVLLAYQLLVASALALMGAAQGRSGWTSLLDVATTVAAVGMVLQALRQDAPRMPDPFLLGLSLGSLGAIGRVLLPAHEAPVTMPLTVVAPIIIVGHLLLAVVALRTRVLPRSVALPLGLTMLVMAVAELVLPTSLGGIPVDVAASVLVIAAAVVWAGSTFAQLRIAVVAQHRRAARLEGSLQQVEGTSRKAREQLHEVRSTIAGLESACRLIADERVEPAARDRLRRTLETEIGRINRMLSPETAAAQAAEEAAPADVDDTLQPVMDLHRARGRQVEWTSTGARFVGRTDALKEAVNILLDNAAVHGGASGSKVDVRSTSDNGVQIAVSDSGPGVPPELRKQIFDWGTSGPQSPGQGIGLNVARRLVAEQGGSLSLSDQTGSGTSFVIHLPSPRRSEENRGGRDEQQ